MDNIIFKFKFSKLLCFTIFNNRNWKGFIIVPRILWLTIRFPNRFGDNFNSKVTFSLSKRGWIWSDIKMNYSDRQITDSRLGVCRWLLIKQSCLSRVVDQNVLTTSHNSYDTRRSISNGNGLLCTYYTITIILKAHVR